MTTVAALGYLLVEAETWYHCAMGYMYVHLTSPHEQYQ